MAVFLSCWSAGRPLIEIDKHVHDFHVVEFKSSFLFGPFYTFTALELNLINNYGGATINRYAVGWSRMQLCSIFTCRQRNNARQYEGHNILLWDTNSDLIEIDKHVNRSQKNYIINYVGHTSERAKNKYTICSCNGYATHRRAIPAFHMQDFPISK